MVLRLSTFPTDVRAAQSVTLSGDATGAGSTAIAVTLASTGIAAGTYGSIVVDAKGRALAGVPIAPARVTGGIAVSTVTATLTLAATTPVTTSLATVWTGSITPSSTTAKVEIACAFFCDASVAATVSFVLSRNAGTATVIGVLPVKVAAAASPETVTMLVYDVPGVTTPVTYTLYCGTSTGTAYINRTSSVTINNVGASNSWHLFDISA